MQECVNCGKVHALQDSDLCGFCTKNYGICSRCKKPYPIRKSGLGQRSVDAVAICIPCLTLAQGICMECGHAIFDDVITQRSGRRGARISSLCPQCFRKSTPLLHTDLPSVGVGASLWKNDQDLLEGMSKLVVVLAAYSPIIPSWAKPTDSKLLVALCGMLPKVSGKCYISFYPSEILLERNKKPSPIPPSFRFEDFMSPVPDKSNPTSAGSRLASVLLGATYSCHSTALVEYWPIELYSFAKNENLLYETYLSPLKGAPAGAVGGTLLLSSSKLQAIMSSGTGIEGGN